MIELLFIRYQPITSIYLIIIHSMYVLCVCVCVLGLRKGFGYQAIKESVLKLPATRKRGEKEKRKSIKKMKGLFIRRFVTSVKLLRRRSGEFSPFESILKKCFTAICCFKSIII